MKKLAPIFNLTTFGCQMNYADSERIVAVLEQAGFKQTTSSQADFLIYNLCSVRQHAIDRIWGIINKIEKQNKNKKKQQIILTGCILSSDKKKFAEKGIIILAIKKLNEWPQKINSLKHLSAKRASLLASQAGKSIKTNYDNEYLNIKPQYSSHYSAYVPVMTGCNNFCSYCAVPYTRGQEYSRPVKKFLEEVNNLIVRGCKEIILLGQNVNSYSNIQEIITSTRKMIKKIGFVELLKMIDKIPGDYWLSFLTSHPKDMTAELIKCFSTCFHLVPYLHLPLQTGSNKILKAMNRHYNLEHYEDLIKKIRQLNKKINISTDIIVGFPGELEADFKKTKKAMEKIKFDMAYLATYSPRPGTAAFKLKDNVSAIEKEKRRDVLNEVLKKTALENNQKMLGLITGVLVDQVKNGVAFGKTRNFKRIKILDNPRPISSKLIGNFIRVKITKANIWNLEGELVSNKVKNIQSR